MLGFNHAIAGSLLYLAAERFVFIGISGPTPPLVNCLGAAVLGSLAPDLDSPQSFLGRRFLPFSWAAKQIILCRREDPFLQEGDERRPNDLL